MLDPGLTVAIVDQLSPYPGLWYVQATKLDSRHVDRPYMFPHHTTGTI